MLTVRKTASDISLIGCIQLCAKERAISPLKVSLALFTLGDENNAGSKCQCGVSDIRVHIFTSRREVYKRGCLLVCLSKNYECAQKLSVKFFET